MHFDSAAFEKLSTLRSEQFRDLVGASFDLHVGDGVATLELVRVQELAPPDDALRGRRPFSLVFEERSSTRRIQATYGLSHPAFGTLPVFLVPVGRSEDGERYAAVFH